MQPAEPPVEPIAEQGSCLCGAIRYEVTSPATQGTNCHCPMCRKQHGAAFATYGNYRQQDFRFLSGAEALRSYASAPGIERQFCGICGSSLFWVETGSEWIEIAYGTLDTEPGRAIDAHMFTGSKASWYPITDHLPQYEAYPEPSPTNHPAAIPISTE